MTTTTTETPEAWVGCLACYNAGRLVGEWVDGTDAADLTTEELHAHDMERAGDLYRQELRAELALAPHEELWVFDYQGYGGLLTGEVSPVEATNIAEAVNAIDEDGYPLAAVKAWLDNQGETLSGLDAWLEHRDAFQDDYRGESASEEDYAEEYADEIGAVSADATWPNTHIDWESAARDLFMDLWSADNPAGGIYVFSNY